MPKNLNLVTKHGYILGGAAADKANRRKCFGSSVAAGMTRYVTGVRVSQRKATGVVSGGSKVYFCSTAASATASTTGTASIAAKMSVYIVSGTASQTVGKDLCIPKQPNPDNPLFTIAASKFFSAYICSVALASAPVDVEVTYYDQ